MVLFFGVVLFGCWVKSDVKDISVCFCVLGIFKKDILLFVICCGDGNVKLGYVMVFMGECSCLVNKEVCFMVVFILICCFIMVL